MYFDSDALVMKNMDRYFESPPARVALPRAYWLTDKEDKSAPLRLGSHVMLVEPNLATYDRIMVRASELRKFDMELINDVFGATAMVLPHRGLAMLSGELRQSEHSRYLGEDADDWNTERELQESHLIHFSDWPLPKPWLHRTHAQWDEALPKCPDEVEGSGEKVVDCPERQAWTNLYASYDFARQETCRFLL